MHNIREIDNNTELELPGQADSQTYRPHWQIFVPTLIVLVGYALTLAYLWATGRSASGLFRFVSVIAAIGIPLLVAHAFLRFGTIRVRLFPSKIQFHPGWPRSVAREIALKSVERVYVKRGPIGKMLGGGTIYIALKSGEIIIVCDLTTPWLLARKINQSLVGSSNR